MDTIKETLDIILEIIDDKKAEDVVVLDVSEKTSIADYFVVATVGSNAQSDAITVELDKKLEELGIEKYNKEGYTNSKWILLDYGDIIVHLFHKDERDYYDLERLWEIVEEN